MLKSIPHHQKNYVFKEPLIFKLKNVNECFGMLYIRSTLFILLKRCSRFISYQFIDIYK